MHRVKDQLEAMSGSSAFTKFNLTEGYYQMCSEEESKEILAFSSPKGLLQWKVLLMGMKTSNAKFQGLVVRMLRDLQHAALLSTMTTLRF